jgi:pimeloyl-ACP methyl ester carboxylesterase
LLARLEATARVRVLPAAGVRVAWHVFGDGPPMVLLHGGHGSWRHWARNIDALAAHFTVWAADMPGYGGSEWPMPGTLDAMAEAMLASLAAAFGPDAPIDLVGFSFGGLVAATLAGRRPGVRRLTLLGPAGHSGRRRPRGELQKWRDAHRSGDAAALAAVMRANLGVHMLHADASVDALALEIHTDACLHTRFRSREISRAGGLQAALDAYGGPVLIAFGEHDVTAEPAIVGPALCDGRPQRHLRVIADAGHWVQFEGAPAVNRLLLAWHGEGDPGA